MNITAPQKKLHFLEKISIKIEKAASEDNLKGKILRFFGIDFLNNVILKGDSDKY